MMLPAIFFNFSGLFLKLLNISHLPSVVPPDCDLHMLSASPVEQKEHNDEAEKTHPNKSVSRLYPRLDLHLLCFSTQL